MRHVPIALVILIAVSSAAQAEDYCEGTTQYAMNMCASREFEQADTAMNERYAKLMKRLDREVQGKLRQAQRAWITYRDKVCEFETTGLGSVRPTILARCLKQQTEAHIKYLDGQLNCEEGDLSCQGRVGNQN